MLSGHVLHDGLAGDPEVSVTALPSVEDFAPDKLNHFPPLDVQQSAHINAGVHATSLNHVMLVPLPKP